MPYYIIINIAIDFCTGELTYVNSPVFEANVIIN